MDSTAQPFADVVETSLEIASAVATAAGPPWEAVGTACEVIGDILEYFFSSNTDGSSPSVPTLSQIDAALLQQSENNAIQSAYATISNALADFKGFTEGSTIPLPASISAGLKDDPDGPFATLYNTLYQTVTGVDQGNAYKNAVGSLASSTGGDVCVLGGNQQATYLPTFAYGVSVYLLLTSYWVSLAYAVDGPAAKDELALEPAISTLRDVPVYGPVNGWIDYAQTVCSTFDTDVQNRLGLISPETPYEASAFLESSTFLSYFVDNGETVAGFDPTSCPGPNMAPWPGDDLVSDYLPSGLGNVAYAVFAGDNDPSVYSAVTVVQQNYVSLMKQTLYNNYFDPVQMQNTINMWNKALTRLESIAT
jgi:hypothetical protein